MKIGKSYMNLKISRQYESLYRNDPEAIFDFSKKYVNAIEARWVGEQLSSWRIDGTSRSIKQIKKLLKIILSAEYE